MFALVMMSAFFVSLFLLVKHGKDQKKNVQSFQKMRGMISAFQSREFDFGMKLTSDDLQVINNYRKKVAPINSEKESAKMIKGKSEKGRAKRIIIHPSF
jgi:homoserine kinase